MQLKYVFFILTIFFMAGVSAQEYSTTWDKSIEVTQGEQEFPDKQTYYAYSTMVYEANSGDVQKAVLADLDAKTTDKQKMKGLKDGVPMSFPEFKGETVVVKVLTESVKKTDQVHVAVAFLKDSVAINPTDFPEEDKAAQSIVRDLSITLNKSVITSQIDEANKKLESLQKDFDKLIKDTMGLVETINKSNEDVMKLQTSIKSDETKLSKAQSEAASLEVIAKSATATSKDMKKYSSAQSKASSIESGIMKDKQKITKAEAEAKEAELQRPILRKQVEDLSGQIEAHKEYIAKLQAKLESVK